MNGIDKLIPVRFLCLVAHLVISTTLLWHCQEIVKSCLPQTYFSVEVTHHHQLQLVVGLSITIGLIVVELLIFLLGITMFNSSSALLSICGHASANVLMCYWVLDGWHCEWFWWIFAFCSVVPVIHDLAVTLNTIIYKKY